MSRIRSIHPGFWTDEALVSLSDAAALFYIGLLNEADDNGIFEWKPLTLRMRLRPTKDGPIDPLLADLLRANTIQKYEMEGRQYGAIRNFCKYQKPKSPKGVHPMSPAVGNYTGSAKRDSEINDDEPPSLPPKGEKPPLMEDGGGGDDGGEGSLRSPREAAELECREAAGLLDDQSRGLGDFSPIWTVIALGYDLATDVLPVLRACRDAGKRGRSWRYYVAAITEAKGANAKIPAKPPAEPVTPMAWVLHDSGEWGRWATAYKATHGKDPPRIAGLGGMGWHFPKTMLEAH